MKNRIYELRQFQKISQGKLAELLKTSQKTISNYELGITEPTIESIIKLANYFDVSIDYLLGKSDIPYSQADTVKGTLRQELYITLTKLNDEQLELIKAMAEQLLKSGS